VLTVAVVVGCGEDPSRRTASPAERAELQSVVHEWLTAVAAGDGAKACGLLTEEVRDHTGAECEATFDQLAGRLIREQREEFEQARIERAFVEGDSANVVLTGRTRYTGPMLTRTFKLERSGGRWQLAEVEEFGALGELTECNVEGLRAFESGDVDPWWKREGRADYRAYIAEMCRRAAQQDLLLAGDTDRAARRLGARAAAWAPRQVRANFGIEGDGSDARGARRAGRCTRMGAGTDRVQKRSVGAA
jgi:hypothetical protein